MTPLQALQEIQNGLVQLGLYDYLKGFALVTVGVATFMYFFGRRS